MLLCPRWRVPGTPEDCDEFPGRSPAPQGSRRHSLCHRGPAAGRRRPAYLYEMSGVSGWPTGPAAVRQDRSPPRAAKPRTPRRRPKIVRQTGNGAFPRTLLMRRRVACPSPPPLSHPAVGTLAPSGAGVLACPKRRSSAIFRALPAPQKTPSSHFRSPSQPFCAGEELWRAPAPAFRTAHPYLIGCVRRGRLTPHTNTKSLASMVAPLASVNCSWEAPPL